MRQIFWCTDIHMDHMKPRELTRFLDDISNVRRDAIAITGDISNAKQLEHHLRMLDEAAQCDVYFVLGNHDAYGGSIAGSDEIAAEVAGTSRHLKYFTPNRRVYELGPGTCVIGHNGWADARMGSFLSSRVNLNDYELIDELKKFDGWKLLLQGALAELGDASAAFISQSLEIALPVFDNVLVLTHVPPFRDACVYGGKISDNDWLPHFSSKVFGDALLQHMDQHPSKRMTVLCGHCFDDDTELLTRSGWKFRSQLQSTDEVVTFNISSKYLEYNKINSFHDYDWNGEMYEIRSKNVDLLVTPGHGLVDMGRGVGNVKLFNAEDWKQGDRTFGCGGVMERQGLLFTDDEIRLAVWIAADGSFERQQVRFHFKKPRKIKRLSDLLHRMGIDFTLSKQAGGTVKMAFDRRLPIIIGLFNEIKQLPAEFALLNSRQFSILLEEYSVTDGSLSSPNGVQISTSKKSEADMIQALAVTSGYRANVIWRDSGYIITVNRKNTQRVNRRTNVNVVNYTGHVWCVSVDNGTLLARRHGKVVITQNTHGAGVACITDNVTVHTGESDYGSPKIQSFVFECE